VPADQEHTWVALSEDEGLAEETAAAIVAEEMLRTEPAAELDQAWMLLTEDEESAEIPTPAVTEEPPAAELVAEPDQAWMLLTEDEVEAAVPPTEAPADALPVEPMAAAEKRTEEAEAEGAALPEWAIAEAADAQLAFAPSIEQELETGPDWVLLAEEEEAAIRTVEEFEPATLPDLVEPEPAARPTWVALEEEPLVEAPAGEPTVPDARVDAAKQRIVVADEENDQARLELARSLWATGQKEQACTEYEQLIRSPLLSAVITDLESITTEKPSEEPILSLLGDAYMKDNRLKDALAAYRRALSSL
jgi:tetratricopeptide (TPR) repeat protein